MADAYIPWWLPADHSLRTGVVDPVEAVAAEPEPVEPEQPAPDPEPVSEAPQEPATP